MREHIKSDAINKQINPEKQSRHDINSDGYVKGRSYLLPGINALELVDKFYGTGMPKFTNAGNWKNKEVVTTSIDIGILVNPDTGEETVTSNFTIHYSRTGTHVVPAPGKE